MIRMKEIDKGKFMYVFKDRPWKDFFWVEGLIEKSNRVDVAATKTDGHRYSCHIDRYWHPDEDVTPKYLSVEVDLVETGFFGSRVPADYELRIGLLCGVRSDDWEIMYLQNDTSRAMIKNKPGLSFSRGTNPQFFRQREFYNDIMKEEGLL